MDWIPVLTLFVNIGVGIFVGRTNEKIVQLEKKLDSFSAILRNVELNCPNCRP